MPGCAITGCGNYSRVTKGTEIKYFRFPKKDNEICKKWVIACRRADEINLKDACVCSAHFEPNCFVGPSFQQQLLQYTPKNNRNLKSDAVPTLNLPGKRINSDNSGKSARLKKRRKALPIIPETKNLNTVFDNNDEQSTSKSALHQKPETTEEKDVLDIANINEQQREILKLKEKLLSLEKENVTLRENLKHTERKDEIFDSPDDINNTMDQQSPGCSSAVENSSEIPLIESTENNHQEFPRTFIKPIMPSRKRIKKVLQDEKEDPRIQKAFEFLQQPIERENSTTIYSQYLAEKLNQFDPRMKSILIHKINELIFETEMKLYSDHSQLSPCDTPSLSLSPSLSTTSMPSPLPAHENSNLSVPVYENLQQSQNDCTSSIKIELHEYVDLD